MKKTSTRKKPPRPEMTKLALDQVRPNGWVPAGIAPPVQEDPEALRKAIASHAAAASELRAKLKASRPHVKGRKPISGVRGKVFVVKAKVSEVLFSALKAEAKRRGIFDTDLLRSLFELGLPISRTLPASMPKEGSTGNTTTTAAG